MSLTNTRASELEDFYADVKDRYVVSFIVTYEGGDDGVQSPAEAAHYALELTRDEASDGTHWIVYDRVTKRFSRFEQSEVEELA